jgi:hypothetical protein
VVYRTLFDQKLVAISDVMTEPTWDDGFGWVARGRFTPITKPIPRAQLLREEALEPVFARIQGRRRLPPAAQETLVALIQDQGRTRLPPHPLFTDVFDEFEPARLRRGRR